MARADLANVADVAKVQTLEKVQVTDFERARERVKISPILGYTMGMKVDFNDRVALHLEGGFPTGLYAGSTLNVRFEPSVLAAKFGDLPVFGSVFTQSCDGRVGGALCGFYGTWNPACLAPVPGRAGWLRPVAQHLDLDTPMRNFETHG